MSKGKKFVAGCCITIGVGMALCIAGFAMGSRVTGVSLGADGISVYTPQGKVGGDQGGSRNGEETLEKFDSIRIEADYADVFVQSAEEYGISYQVDNRYRFSYEIKGGTLVVKEIADGGFNVGFVHFGYGMSNGAEKGRITVRLPKGSELSEVVIDNDYGDIICGDFSAEKLEIDSDYGYVELGEVESENAAISLDSGDFELSSFSGGDMTVDSDYGNINIEEITARNLKFETDSGNLSAGLVQAESFAVDSDYGDVELKDVTVGELNLITDSGNISLAGIKTDNLMLDSAYGNVKGKNIEIAALTGEIDSGDCELEELAVKNVKLDSDSGNVILKLVTPLTDYSYQLETDFGNILLDGRDMGEKYQSLEQGEKQMEIFCDSGNIEIDGVQ